MSTQAFDETPPDHPEFDTIAQALGEPRRELLVALLETDRSHLNTSQLRDRTAVARGSILHHLERLVTWGLVAELDTREYHGQSGITARTWQLTDDGQQFCEHDEYMDLPESAFVSPEAVAGLKRQLTDLEANAQERDDKLDRLDRMLEWIITEGGIFNETEQAKILDGEPVE